MRNQIQRRFISARRAALLTATGVALAAIPHTAFAQTASATADADDASQLGEIVVTAQKRSENVQKVPISITALSSAAIEDRKVSGVADLAKLVPSMFVSQNYGANVVSIRGISTGLTSGAEDPSVAVHVNGVYQPRSRSLDVAAMDLDRIEVLSGPQGTLYGRNATGGVINYITKGPADKFEGSVTGSVANYSRFGIKGYVSGPLSDNVGIRVSGLWDDQGTGYIKNLLPGAPNKTIGDSNTLGGHVTLAIKASDSVKFVLDGIYARTNSSNIFEAFGPTSYGSGIAALLGRQSFKPHEVYSPYPASFNNKYFQTSLTGTFDLSSDVQLKSITAYQGYEDQMNIDNSSSEILSVAVNQHDRSRTFTQELDLTTHTFSDKLTSVFGLFYFHDDLNIDTLVPFAIAPAPNFYHYKTQQNSESYAFFTDQTLNVTDHFRVIAGLRYNHDTKSVANQLTVQATGTGPSVFDVCSTTNNRAWNAWTYKGGVQFDAADNVMLFGSYQKGFKAGGFVANTCGNPFDPETIQGPEIGFKSELFDRHLRLNVSAYYYKYKNLQVQKVVGIGQFSVQNAAEATLKGIEASAVAKLTPNFTIDLSANVQSAKYDAFLNCDNTDPTGPCSASPVVLVNLKGQWLNKAPPYSINLGAEYRAEVAGGELLFRAESYWSGKVRFDPYQTLAAMGQPAYSVQNVFLTYTPAGGRFQVRGFIKNIGDTDYKSAAFFNSAVGEPTGSWAAPRTFGGEVTVKF